MSLASRGIVGDGGKQESESLGRGPGDGSPLRASIDSQYLYVNNTSGHGGARPCPLSYRASRDVCLGETIGHAHPAENVTDADARETGVHGRSVLRGLGDARAVDACRHRSLSTLSPAAVAALCLLHPTLVRSRRSFAIGPRSPLDVCPATIVRAAGAMLSHSLVKRCRSHTGTPSSLSVSS